MGQNPRNLRGCEFVRCKVNSASQERLPLLEDQCRKGSDVSHTNHLQLAGGREWEGKSSLVQSGHMIWTREVLHKEAWRQDRVGHAKRFDVAFNCRFALKI